MVFAGSDRVWSAALVRVVVASGDQTSVGKVLPGGLGEATIAAEATARAASNQVLGRDVEVGLSLTLNADTIGHGLNSAKSPAKNEQINLTF